MATFAFLCVSVVFTCSRTGKDFLHENNINLSSRSQVMSLENVNEIYKGDVKNLDGGRAFLPVVLNKPNKKD